MAFDFSRHRGSWGDKEQEEEEEVWRVLARLGGPRLRDLSDPFFEEGDRISDMREPQVFETFDSEEFLHKDYKPFPCSEPGCSKVFAQLIDSEAHYNTVHRFPCSECPSGFISSHLQELHLLETHDAFFKILSHKRPSYACFLEICSEKFWTPSDRLAHGVEDHGFDPKLKYFNPQSKEGTRVGDKKKLSRSPERKKKSIRPVSMALSSQGRREEEGDGSRFKSKGPRPAKSTHNLSPSKAATQNPNNYYLRPSKIPLRSFSYKNISFGSGISKTFDTSSPLNQGWIDSRRRLSTESPSKKKAPKNDSLEIHNMEDIKKYLPSIK